MARRLPFRPVVSRLALTSYFNLMDTVSGTMEQAQARLGSFLKEMQERPSAI